MAEYAHLIVPRLMIIAERGYCTSAISWLQKIELLYGVVGSISNVVIQIRNKAAPKDWHVVEPICRQITQQTDNKVYINGHQWPDLSLSRHLPEALLTINHHPNDVGASVHSLEALSKAETHKLHYVQYGAIFPTSKPVIPLGTTALQEICVHTTLPVLAVGGIQSMEQITQCMNAGAYGVSIGSWILHSSNPQRLIEDITLHIEHHGALRSEFR